MRLRSDTTVRAVSDISQSLEGPWPATVGQVPGPERSIIHAARESDTTYLYNIDLLWQLGLKPSSVVLKSAIGEPFNPSSSNSNVDF